MSRKPVVMISGASRGLGKELARAFAARGAALALCARGGGELEKLCAELAEHGADVLATAADAADPRDVERFVSLAETRFGRIDVLINNASILGPSPMPMLLDYPEDDFAEVLRVNIASAFLLTKRVLPGMLRRNAGSVINVTSEAGHVGYAGWGAYGVSKFGLEGLTQTWADELKDTGIRVNMVDPGEMDTAMHAAAVPDCDYGLADPRDVVPVFLYLASDRAAGVHGERLNAEAFDENGKKGEERRD